MAIPNLKTKIKQNLKKDIEAEKSKGNDARLLNYFDLKSDEKMTILFVPDVNGNFWSKFSKHGPNLHIIKDKKKMSVRGADSINCAYKSSGDDCPACQKGFDIFNEANDTGDKDLREEGKKWMSRDYTLVSCIVLESPFEVTSDEKNNQVKLMYLPYAVENLIKEAITEGLIDEDELCQTPFVVKKTKNSGGWADYSNSYFARKPIQDGDLDFLEDLVVEQYDYENLDLIPAPTSTEEVAEWLEKAEAAYQKALGGSSDDSEEEEDDRPVRKQKSALDNLTKRKKDRAPEPEEQEEEDHDDPEEQDEPEQQEEEQEEEERTSTSSQMDRLRALSRGRRQ